MAPWRIVLLEVLPAYQLKVQFVDGVEGVVDLAEFIASDRSGTVFEGFENEDFFKKAYLNYGAVTWPGEIDLAPDAMHKEIICGGGMYRVPPIQQKAA